MNPSRKQGRILGEVTDMVQTTMRISGSQQQSDDQTAFWNPFKETEAAYELSFPILKDRAGRLAIRVRGDGLEIHGNVLRTFVLPADADRRAVSAHYAKGLLTLRIPRLPRERDHRDFLCDPSETFASSLLFFFQRRTPALAVK